MLLEIEQKDSIVTMSRTLNEKTRHIALTRHGIRPREKSSQGIGIIFGIRFSTMSDFQNENRR